MYPKRLTCFSLSSELSHGPLFGEKHEGAALFAVPQHTVKGWGLEVQEDGQLKCMLKAVRNFRTRIAESADIRESVRWIGRAFGSERKND